MANRIGTLELMKKSKSGLTYALVAVIVTVSGVPNQLFCQEQQSRKQTLADGLKESGNTLLKSTLNDNAEGIVALWSESGVAIGIDGPIVSKLEIRREFQTKSRNFCLFFSTDCLRKQAGFELKDCYKDLLLEAGDKQITYRVSREGKSVIGEMRVNLKGEPASMSKAANPLEFDFLYEKGHWKLVSLPAI